LTGDIDLGEIERRAVAAYYEDGLLDIFVGGYLLFVGLIAITDFAHRHVLIWILPPSLGTLLYNEAKKRVTYPRVGFMKFTKERSVRVAFNTMIVFIAVGLVTLTGLFTGMGVPENAPWGVLLLNRYNLLFQGGVLASIFLLLSRVMSVARLRIYSVISILVYLAGYIYLESPFIVSSQSLGVPCAIIGVVMACIGASQLRRFIDKYPKEGLAS
jgi:hypothetical protein